MYKAQSHQTEIGIIRQIEQLTNSPMLKSHIALNVGAA